MKKFFAIALIAASFAACNSTENKTEETKSDTTVKVVPQAPDTIKTITDTTVHTKQVVEEGKNNKINVDTMKH